MQNDGTSPSSRGSVDTATTIALNGVNPATKCASQFNPAAFDTQSIRSRRLLNFYVKKLPNFIKNILNANVKILSV